MGFYEDMEKSLLEAIAMEKGGLPLTEKEDMPAMTYVVSDAEKKLVDQMVVIRKEKKMSQAQLARLTGYKQQAISRLEKKENSPTLRVFANILYALGYELQIVKREHYR